MDYSLYVSVIMEDLKLDCYTHTLEIINQYNIAWRTAINQGYIRLINLFNFYEKSVMLESNSEKIYF